jgi:hypothetical protein
MGNRRSQLDMPHPLTPDRGAGHFDTAPLADHTPETDVFVFATGTLPIPRRPEDRLTKEAIPFWAKATIVDSFRFGDLTI